MIVATKITLPTVDIVTDALSINKVLSYEYDTYQRKKAEVQAIAYAMMFIMIFSLIMTIPHFLRVEKTWRQRLKGLPFLLISSWPQYRGFRLLWLSIWVKNQQKLDAENEEFEQNLSHVGEFMK